MSERIAFVVSALSGDELSGGKRDATKMYDLLTDPKLGACNLRGPSPFLDCPNSQEFTLKFQELLRALNPDDQLIFYFTGHGHVIDGLLALQVGPSDTELMVFENIIRDFSIRHFKKGIFIIDACHSGAVVGQKGNLNDLNSLEKIKVPHGIAIIASSRDFEKSFELEDGSGSVFTHLLCTGIKSGLDNEPTPDNVITIEQIVNYINTKLRDPDFEDYIQTSSYKVFGAENTIWLSLNPSGKSKDEKAKEPAYDVLDEAQLKLAYEKTVSSKHPCLGATYDDLDWDLIDKFADSELEQGRNEFKDRVELLNQLKLFSPLDSSKILHKAAFLCFSKAPSRIIHQAETVVAIGDPSGKSFVRKDIKGSLSLQIEKTLRLVMANLNFLSIFGKGSRPKEEPEIPEEVIREILSNAIAHRDYSINATVQVRLKHDCLEIQNPGSFPDGISWSDLISGTIGSKPVDAAITYYLVRLRSVERIGRGSEVVRDYLNENGKDAISCQLLPGPSILISIKRGKSLTTDSDELISTKQLVASSTPFGRETQKRVVYISYSHKDKKWVRDYLLPNLEKNGIPCHIDYRDFEKGMPGIANMERAIESCRKTILVFTQNWFSSENTQFEAAMLQVIDPTGAKGKIIPILLEKTEIPLRFQVYSYYDFTDDNKSDSELNRLVNDLKLEPVLEEPEKKTYPPLKDLHIDTTRLPQTGLELFDRPSELTLLNESWESGATNIVSFVAYGGVGKSTLVNKWVERMRWDNYRGAEKVYAWSFYSQGTGERVTSADMFVKHALEWFGDADPKQGSPWDKGKRLAKLINNHKTLLILDGLEPLQAAGKIERGRIKDPALTTLVTELARSNKGLCVITTREHLPELDRYPKTTKQENLEHLSDEAGRKLLETRRILGSEEELEHIVRQFGNHALAINLLAEYLHIFKDPPLEKANSIPDLDIPDEEGKHARRVIEAFANRFDSASAEFQLLSILGLFDRPVPIDAINAIIRDNPVPGLSDKITDTSGSGWLTTLESLRKHKLLFGKSEHSPDTLDCYPLVREHFGEKLQQQNPNAWKQAHARLYEYYRNLPEKELPDTLEEMGPLFAAVMHGCLAGKHREAMDDVYWERIQRGNDRYILFKLGAFGRDLSCLSMFFERLWDKPAAKLTERLKSTVLSWAGFSLRAVARLSEAAQPMKAGLEVSKRDKDWEGAAVDASNLSELYLTLGDVATAQKYGEQSVTFADRSGDGFMKEAMRTTHADVLHQAGKSKAAEKLFVEAENIQKKSLPEYPWLYGLAGFQFCDLLLFIGKYEEVLERARTAMKTAEKNRWLLDIALDNLSIGKALMLQAVDNNSSGFSEAQDYLNQAVNGLREAGQQDDLPRGLFARATLFRHQKDFLKSWADLDEAREIAEYGQMRLHLTDYHLEACRNIREQLSAKDYQIIENGETLSLTKEEMQERFKEHFKDAERLINETGYHRRDGELEELRTNSVE